MRAARSLLAVPATGRKMVEKALASDADAVFLDLEDAVAPDDKAGARGDVVRALQELDWRGRPTLFRANALDTPYFYRDLIEVVEAGRRLPGRRHGPQGEPPRGPLRRRRPARRNWSWRRTSNRAR